MLAPRELGVTGGEQTRQTRMVWPTVTEVPLRLAAVEPDDFAGWAPSGGERRVGLPVPQMAPPPPGATVSGG
jgi:hypothetical protein